ncbi:MAG: energy transducer TonB [Myxococcota bacterium]|nr:energy transducer TonB [Myxococcota bacterium]
MRLQGELRLEFCVDGRGEAIGVRVAGGSGVPLLDRAATECLIPRAFPVPEVRGGCFQVPVRFGRN